MQASERGAERERSATASLPPWSARPWERGEYQRIWLQMACRAWRTLAVVPAEEGMSTLDVAKLVMALGVAQGESIGVFDFRDVRVNRVADALRGARSQLDDGERLVFPTRSIRENLATIPLARATDAAVLCVSLGSTSMELAAETVGQIGKERFIGSILVRGPRSEAPDPRGIEQRRRLEARC